MYFYFHYHFYLYLFTEDRNDQVANYACFIFKTDAMACALLMRNSPGYVLHTDLPYEFID